MAIMIDSSLWVDFFRLQTPLAIKRQIMGWVDKPDAVLCEPIRFEVLRAARRAERQCVEETFATLPLLATASDLWERAIELGQNCFDAGVNPPAMDLLIAVSSLDHGAELVSFDMHFSEIAKVCPLKVRVLTRGRA